MIIHQLREMIQTLPDDANVYVLFDGACGNAEAVEVRDECAWIVHPDGTRYYGPTGKKALWILQYKEDLTSQSNSAQ